MKTAAIYARVSSDKQKEENTIASQTSALIAFAREQNCDVPAEWGIEDGGYSNFVSWHAEGWDWVKKNSVSSPLYGKDIPGKIGVNFDATQITFGIYGFLLVIMMILRPQGLLPEKRHELELTEHAETTDENLYTARA